jgi:hypothetical protein
VQLAFRRSRQANLAIIDRDRRVLCNDGLASGEQTGLDITYMVVRQRVLSNVDDGVKNGSDKSKSNSHVPKTMIRFVNRIAAWSQINNNKQKKCYEEFRNSL